MVLTIGLWSYKEEIREVPDRWHGPLLNPEPASSLKSPSDIFRANDGYKVQDHPIDDLAKAAERKAEELLSKETRNTSAAAAAYRARRGRHPPPGFDAWVEYALSQDCIVVEDFFDQIYRDIEPFLGLKASEIRDAAANLPDVIRIRDGRVQPTTSEWHFVTAYHDMFSEIAMYLPDVDLPINTMDESRVLVPWENINELMLHSAESKNLHKVPTKLSFGPYGNEKLSHYDHSWLHEGPYWDIARNGCHPETPGRSAVLDANFSTPPQFLRGWPSFSQQGYVANWTVAKDPCIHAQLCNLHGSFVEPISQSTTTRLIPIFSGSKMPFNNDILLPPAVYWLEDDRFSTKHARYSWSDKRDEVLWRGSASGGRNTEHNWTRFQRHRLLSMLNGTQIEMAIDAHNASLTDSGKPPGQDVPQNFPLPNQDVYLLHSVAQGLLPDWIRSFSNAAFT